MFSMHVISPIGELIKITDRVSIILVGLTPARSETPGMRSSSASKGFPIWSNAMAEKHL